MITDTEKQALWQSYFERRPIRVPMRLNTTQRVVIMDPKWNPDGITFEDVFRDPESHVEIALRHELWRRQVLGPRSDLPREIPEVWTINYSCQNFYEAASLGAEIIFLPGQVPDTRPYLDGSNKRELFDLPIEQPFELPFLHNGLAFWEEMERICRDHTFEDRQVKLLPWDLTSSDGPLTVACNLRGGDIFAEIMSDREYAQELFAFIVRAGVARRNAFYQQFGDRLPRVNNLADDSCALISTKMYTECILPHHRAWYDSGPADPDRLIHLCGDATRHFKTIHEELGVTSFDTGYPIDFGTMREELGPEVELTGGPEVALLLEETPDAVYQRCQSILESGVKEGGRFILQEANNLPPLVPPENLDAMYSACLDFGGHVG